LAATFTDGIWVLNKKLGRQELLLREPLRINNLAILKDELWVSTDNDGIVILDVKSYEEKKRLDNSAGLGVQHIRKVITDTRTNVWIATSGGGFYKYFENNFKHYDRDTGLKGDRVYAVHATPQILRPDF